MAKQWKVLTNDEFNLIKLMSKADISDAQIAKGVNRSRTTIARIKKYDNLEDYRIAERETRYAYKKAELANKTAKQDTTKAPVIESLVSNSDEIFDYKLLNDNLVLLANKMEKYADACDKLAIATYALRKSAGGDKLFWRK